MAIYDSSYILLGVTVGLALAGGAAAAGPVELGFPSPVSNRECSSGATGPLGGGGGGLCFQAGDELVQTFTAAVPAGVVFTRSRWQFTMDDLTNDGVPNDFDLEINGVVAGSFEMRGGTPNLQTLDLTFEHAPIEGPDVTLRIVATSTVPASSGSWNWFAGGTVTLLPPTDEYACYPSKDLKDPAFVKVDAVPLTDAFGAGDVSLKKPSLVCRPTSRSGGGLVQAGVSLCCYAAKAAKLAAKTGFLTSDALGDLTQQVKKASLFCVPCTVTAVP